MSLLESLINIPPVILIAIISLLISLIIVLAYKYLTDQEMMKNLREEIKKLQSELKAQRGNPKRAAEINKRLMEKSMQQFRHSFKPTLFTLIPIILIFGWLNSTIAYEPLHPNEEFNVSVFANSEINFSSIPNLTLVSQKRFENWFSYILKGDEGEYTLWFESGNEKRSADVIITEKQRYAKPIITFKDGEIKKIVIGNNEMKPFGKYFNIFGWKPGWIGTYIIFSLVFSILLRKILRVY